jgi:hypothetical protein
MVGTDLNEQTVTMKHDFIAKCRCRIKQAILKNCQPLAGNVITFYHQLSPRGAQCPNNKVTYAHATLNANPIRFFLA